jgi:Limiting CO2-inducible proteins B/C beta carbonyic anhydrases
LFETLNPGLISYRNLIGLISSLQVDVGANSVLVTSFCTGDCNCNSCEHELSGIFLQTHTIGGLSGVPFNGAKAFIEVLAGIPIGGNCFLFYGPHVDIDARTPGNPSFRENAFKRYGGCSGAVNAVAYARDKSIPTTPNFSMGSEQFFLNQLLFSRGQHFNIAAESSLELPMLLYDFQTALINRYIDKGCRHIQADQLIVILGGFQLNSPKGMPDYFLPLRLDVVNRHGNLLKKIERPELDSISATRQS